MANPNKRTVVGNRFFVTVAGIDYEVFEGNEYLGHIHNGTTPQGPAVLGPTIGNLIIRDGLEVTGSLYAGSSYLQDLTVTGFIRNFGVTELYSLTSIYGYLDVFDFANFNNNVSISGTLSVTGTTTLSTLVVSGNASVGSLTSLGDVDISGNITLTGTVDGVDISDFKIDYDGTVADYAAHKADPNAHHAPAPGVAKHKHDADSITAGGYLDPGNTKFSSAGHTGPLDMHWVNTYNRWVPYAVYK